MVLRVLQRSLPSGQMQARSRIILFVLLVGGSYLLGQWLSHQASVELPVIHVTVGACNPAETGCRLAYNGHQLTVRFSGEPSALVPFTVNALNEFPGVNRISIDFVMPGMDMEINQLVLKQSSDRQWTVEGLLPVCSLGGDDWLARFNIYQPDRILQADLRFQTSRR